MLKCNARGGQVATVAGFKRSKREASRPSIACSALLSPYPTSSSILPSTIVALTLRGARFFVSLCCLCSLLSRTRSTVMMLLARMVFVVSNMFSFFFRLTYLHSSFLPVPLDRRNYATQLYTLLV